MEVSCKFGDNGNRWRATRWKCVLPRARGSYRRYTRFVSAFSLATLSTATIIKLGGIKNLKIEFEDYPSIILFLGEINFQSNWWNSFFFFKYIIYNCSSIYICSPIESIYKAFWIKIAYTLLTHKTYDSMHPIFVYSPMEMHRMNFCQQLSSQFPRKE